MIASTSSHQHVAPNSSSKTTSIVRDPNPIDQRGSIAVEKVRYEYLLKLEQNYSHIIAAGVKKEIEKGKT